MEDIMRIDKPDIMSQKNLNLLSSINLAPYIQLATELTKKIRRSGGNAFRHQMATLSVLIDYGYIEPILLKASIIHDTIEDLPNFDKNLIKKADSDGESVLELVLEVTRKPEESKQDFLKRIIKQGSNNAKILKVADRITNMQELGYVTDASFIERTCNDTENIILPTALLVNYPMYLELLSLLESRQKYLENIGYYNK